MDANQYLIVGFGNPGTEYCDNRHNIGFQVVDDLARKWNQDRFIEKWQAVSSSVSVYAQKVHLVKPATFMNLSGKSVVQYYRFFKIAPDHLLVIHDDLDMSPGRIKLVKGGGTGGHNGIKSAVEWLGTNDFFRLKIGIGRPGKGNVSPGFPIEKYVLSDFDASERVLIESRFPQLEEGIRLYVCGMPDKAMSLLNSLK